MVHLKNSYKKTPKSIKQLFEFEFTIIIIIIIRQMLIDLQRM